MGSSFCKNGDSSQINTLLVVDPQPQPLNPEPKINSQIVIKNSDQLTSQGSDKVQQNQSRKCSKCKQNISLTFVQVNCQKNCSFHHLCIEEHFKKLIESGIPIIKCECGTKLNTIFLRQSQIAGKMNLLSRLFEKQLDIILQSQQQIRRDVDVQNYVKENRLAKELEDYLLIDQNTLIYEETPQ